MVRSKRSPKRPAGRVTHLDTSLSPRPRDTSPAFVQGHRPPPQAVLDRMAEETIHKGWTGKRHPLCRVCFTRKASKGGCNCPSDITASSLKRYTSPKRDVSAISQATGSM